MSETPNVGFVTDLLLHAGDVTRRCFEDLVSLKFTEKGNGDLVTEADTAVEKLLVDTIRTEFPNHTILAEESVGAPCDTAGWLWVIDPLDGTANFACGVPFYAISVALLEEGEPIGAWVLDPIRDELFTAERGGPAKLNGEVFTAMERPISLVGVSSGVVSGWADGTLTWNRDLLDRFGKIRNLGAQALQICYVAAGRLTANLSCEARLWDDAAGALIALRAGAKYTAWDGSPVFPVEPGAKVLGGAPIKSLAAHPAVHGEIVAITARGN